MTPPKSPIWFASLVLRHAADGLTALQNSLYNSALRQGSSIRRDLDALAEGIHSSPALLGMLRLLCPTPYLTAIDQRRPDQHLFDILFADYRRLQQASEAGAGYGEAVKSLRSDKELSIRAIRISGPVRAFKTRDRRKSK